MVRGDICGTIHSKLSGLFLQGDKDRGVDGWPSIRGDEKIRYPMAKDASTHIWTKSVSLDQLYHDFGIKTDLLWYPA